MATKHQTASIGVAQATSVFHAVRFATEGERALNLLVTVNLSQLGIPEALAGDKFRAVWKSFVRWWNYERSKGKALGTFDAYAVHENPDGKRHVHWMLHAPDEAKADIIAAIEKRVCKLAEVDCAGTALHFLPVNKPGGVTKYALKGVNPAYASYFHMRARDQGTVSGRRVAISRSIGRAARHRAGWKRKKTKAK